jgi:hypothetical protein
MVSPNQDPYEVPTLKHWRIIHTYMTRIKSYYMNSWVTKEIHRQWSVRVKNIAEAKPKYYHSPIQGHVSVHNSQRVVGKSQAPGDNRLLGLPDPYHRHAIGTLNTCSRGPTERSLIDTGGGYNLGGAGLPHTHSTTFPTSCPHFSLMAPPGLHFNQILARRPKCWVLKNLWPPRGLSTTRPSTMAYIYA